MGNDPRRLVALICAYSEREDAAGALRAALPLAGRSLLERQALAAIAAGAETLLVVTNPSDPAMTAAAGRLAADGTAVQLAGDAVDAARRVEAGDAILLVGDGALVDEEEVARLTEQDGYSILTVADDSPDQRFERIDADARWAGFALIDGRLLRDTASMLDDWDLQSTLLRRAVQQGARQVRVAPEAVPLVALEAGDLTKLEDDLLRGVGGHQRDWVSRYLLAPLEAVATRRLITEPVTPAHLHGAALASIFLAALACLFGWSWAGLVLYLVATPLAGVGERVGRLTGTEGVAARLRHALPLTAAFCCLALGWHLSATSGWGAGVLAAAMIAFATALAGEHPRRSGWGLFLADYKGLGWLMLPFAAIGHWTIGLGVLTLYAAGSFFIAQRQAHVSLARKD